MRNGIIICSSADLARNPFAIGTTRGPSWDADDFLSRFPTFSYPGGFQLCRTLPQRTCVC